MKKFFNFLFHTLAIMGLIAGGYYLYQKYVLKDADSEDIEKEDFEDFTFDDEDFTETASDTREYVTLNSSESKAVQNEEEISDEDFDEISD